MAVAFLSRLLKSEAALAAAPPGPEGAIAGGSPSGVLVTDRGAPKHGLGSPRNLAIRVLKALDFPYNCFSRVMDVARKFSARKRLAKRAGLAGAALAGVWLVSAGLARLKPAAPLAGSGIWVDTVRRGDMLRQVRGLGTLVPEETLLIPAATDGRVDRRLILPGTPVKLDTVVLELSNPELETALIDAEFQLKAEAGYTDLRVQLESKGLDQRAVAAQVRAEFHAARLQADRDLKLAKEGLIPDLAMRLSTVKAEELETRYELEKKRLEIATESVEAQLAASRVKVEQLRAQLQLKRSQVQALKVRAGAVGVLQQIAVEVGQRVAAGAVLARVSQPSKLKAELKIPETQAKEIMAGQRAEIDTRNGIIPGRVSRIDPAAVSGTVTVDVRLEGRLPQGARPDLSVDGSIELEHLRNVLYPEFPFWLPVRKQYTPTPPSCEPPWSVLIIREPCSSPHGAV
ncbi:MAG: HlyD family efflux transporter periplasmic adaptor subunit, partial [Acidobacteria bacterium]|nr:HlyD family efflux transporter periplasmic adaptor subunit [Acidobacteriota bacterium]